MNHPRSAVCIALCSMFLLSGTVSAVSTTTWTTTEDFDNGTYSESEGNRETNSNSCNLGITDNTMELDSIKGDAFCITDDDADTFKWNRFTSDGVGCASMTLAIHNGYLDTDATAGSVSWCRVGTVSGVSVTGNWDVSIKITKTVDIGTISFWELSLFSGSNSFCRDASDDGLHYRDIDGVLQAYTCVNSGYASVGSNTASPSSPYWLRIVRLTNTFTFFYSTDGSLWTQDETTINANIPNPLYVYLTIYADSNTDSTGGDFDDYWLASGTVSPGGYRDSGYWVSSEFPIPTGDRVYSVNWTETGTTIDRCVVHVELRSNGGETIESWEDFDCLVPPLFSGNVVTSVGSIRLRLVSDGEGTMNIADVSVETTLESSLNVLMFLILFLIVFLFAVGIVHPIFWFLCSFVSFLGAATFTIQYPDTLWAFVFVVFGVMLIVVTIARITGMRLGLNKEKGK